MRDLTERDRGYIAELPVRYVELAAQYQNPNTAS
jgi:hypothetical protein